MLISEAFASTAATGGHETAAFYATPEFWVGVAFVIVVLALLKPMGKFVKSATSARADKISQKIDEARRLKDEAAALLAEYQQRFKDADKESAAILDRAKVNAERLKKDEEEKMNLLLAKKEEKAYDRIKSAEHGAVSEIKDCAIKNAVLVSNVVIMDKIADKISGKLVKNSIAELPEKIKAAAS